MIVDIFHDLRYHGYVKLALLFFVLCVFALASYSQPTDRPAFVAQDMDGAKIDTDKLRGKVVVLNLWFINCPNCLEEIKELNALVDEYKNEPDVVFLAPAASPKAELEKFLSKNPFKYKVIPDAAALILMKFRTPDKDGDLSLPFPMHCVLDRDGKIVTKEHGIKGIAKVRAELKKQLGTKQKP